MQSAAWGRSVTAPPAATTSSLLSRAERRAGEPLPSEDPALLARVARCPLDVAVVLWDEEAAVAAVSPGFEALTGFRMTEATGSSLRFLRSGLDEQPETRLQVAVCKLHGVACRIRRSIVRKSGELVQCVAHYQRLPAEPSLDGLTFSIFAFHDQVDVDSSIDAAVACMLLVGSCDSHLDILSEALILTRERDVTSSSGSDMVDDAMSKACSIDALGCLVDVQRALQTYVGTSALLASVSLGVLVASIALSKRRES